MIINKYKFNKQNLTITIRLLKKNYQEGWESVGFSVTYDQEILLMDSVFNHEGFFQFGYVNYTKIVKQIKSEDVEKITDVLYRIINNDTGLNFKKEVGRQLEWLSKGKDYRIDRAIVDDKEVTTYEQVIKGYRPDKDLELYYTGRVKEYLTKNNLIEDYDIEDYQESKLTTIVRFRGQSVVIQGWINGTLKFEEDFHVNSDGTFNGSIMVAYKAIVYKDREDALKRIKKQ